MIALSGVAVFAGLFLLILMALPGPRVGKSRLGIERKPMNVGRSMNDFLERHGKRRGIAQALALADISTDPGQFALRVLLISLLAAVLGLVISPILALVGLVVPGLVTRAWVHMKGAKRQAKFAEQLPDMLQLVIASVKSGFGLTQALEALTEEIDEPARSEIAQVMAETRMGRDLSDSLHSLSERMENRDLEWVIGAIGINRETGGNLAEILGNVNNTIRERQRIGRKVRTFTAEGRLSAKVLFVLPILIGLLEWRSNPDGFAHLFSGLGLVFLCLAMVLLLVGTFWIRKIASIKF
jgi:tight adherence protein B